jgi:phosphoglycerate dehydrogenase-like enzyme
VKVLLALDEPEALARLRAAHPGVRFVATRDPVALRGEIADADAFVGHPTPEQLAAATRLRWVQFPSVGAEWIHDLPTLVASDVPVTTVRGSFSQTIAEHAFALLLALTRGLPFWQRQQAARAWGGDGRAEPRLVALAGATMVVLGFGSIGRAVARRGLGFEMRVVGVDRHDVPPMEGVVTRPLDQLEAALDEADALVVTVPITPRTRGMLSRRELARLRPGGYLIVVSRGGVVDELALVEALRSGHLAGAGLDVTAQEPPPPDSRLWDAPNLVLTPHNSGVSPLTGELRWGIIDQNVGRFRRGEPLLNVIDKQLGY